MRTPDGFVVSRRAPQSSGLAVRMPAEDGNDQCHNPGCDTMEETWQYFKVGRGRMWGGHDWSACSDSTLCNACFNRYLKTGTLDQSRDVVLLTDLEGVEHCTYERCESPLKSSRFNYIYDGTSAGGQDWSSIVGSVLCDACFQRFSERGTLEKPKNRLLSPSATRQCMNEECDNQDKNSQLHQIEEARISGGKDWSAMVGKVLCNACYERYLVGGTPGMPKESDKGGETRSLVGGTFGMLKKSEEGRGWRRSSSSSVAIPEQEQDHTMGRKPEGNNQREKRCTNELCERPDESSQFYKIEPGRTTGGHDWSSISGHLLCKACYNRFLRRGTLILQPLPALSPLTPPLSPCEVPSGKKEARKACGNPVCDSTCTILHKITGSGEKVGSAMWGFTTGVFTGSAAGNFLCDRCYRKTRMFRRSDKKKRRKMSDCSDDDSPTMRCTYEHCERPDETSKFHTIEEGKSTGGQDWSSIVGWCLCNACYQRYARTGSCYKVNNGGRVGDANRRWEHRFMHQNSRAHGAGGGSNGSSKPSSRERDEC